MKPGLVQPGERRGLFCPRCGEALTVRLVAMSYPSPAGQSRRRVCSCGADVETTEVVAGMTAEIVDVSALNPDQLRLIRQMVAQFTRENVTIEMPHARVQACALTIAGGAG